MKYFLVLILISSFSYSMRTNILLPDDLKPENRLPENILLSTFSLSPANSFIDKIFFRSPLREVLPLLQNNPDPERAFRIAVAYGREDIACALVHAGFNVNRRLKTNAGLIMPLLLAAEKNMCALAVQLLDKGAYIDYQSFPSGVTALMIACLYGHPEMVGLLLSARAKTDIRNNSKRPVYAYCVLSDVSSDEQRMKRDVIYRMLLKYS